MVRGGVLGICQDGTPTLLHCGIGCGGGVRERTMPLAWHLPCFQLLPPLPISILGPFWCCFQGGWVCVCSRTPWVSPKNSPVRLGVSSATTPGLYSQRFWGCSFLAGTLGCTVCLVPQLFLPAYPHANVGSPSPLATTWPCSVSCLAAHPLHLGCPTPPLLPVWINVSFLTPWLLDFHNGSIFWQFWLLFVFKFVVVLLLVVQGSKACLPTPPSWLAVLKEVISGLLI